MFSKVNSKELNLLVVDDEQSVARMIERTQRKLWKSVVLAYSDDEGIEAIKRGGIDVVLSDWACPLEGGGLRVAQASDLPVVIQTGTAGVTCPGVQVLYKPVDTPDLYDALMEACRRKAK